MVRVSGVPYEVDLEIVSTLEQENRQIRARMDRLEDELKVANELITKLSIDNNNLRQKLSVYE